MKDWNSGIVKRRNCLVEPIKKANRVKAGWKEDFFLEPTSLSKSKIRDVRKFMDCEKELDSQ